MIQFLISEHFIRWFSLDFFSLNIWYFLDILMCPYHFAIHTDNWEKCHALSSHDYTII